MPCHHYAAARPRPELTRQQREHNLSLLFDLVGPELEQLERKHAGASGSSSSRDVKGKGKERALPDPPRPSAKDQVDADMTEEIGRAHV